MLLTCSHSSLMNHGQIANQDDTFLKKKKKKSYIDHFSFQLHNMITMFTSCICCMSCMSLITLKYNTLLLFLLKNTQIMHHLFSTLVMEVCCIVIMNVAHQYNQEKWVNLTLLIQNFGIISNREKCKDYPQLA